MIETQASKVIDEYHSNDPFIIAEKMNINVFTRPLVDIGGYYMVLKNNVKIAVIDSGLSRHLQKFVLAHEIGHSLLHPEKGAFMLKTSLFATNRQEVEADKFAIELLLTDSMVNDNIDYTVDNWATVLGLPREIIELRWR